MKAKGERKRAWKPRPDFVPRIVYGLDTEDKDGDPTLYGIESRLGSTAYKAGPESRLAILEEFTRSGGPVAIFCLNLQYDLVNLFGEALLDVVQPFCARKRLVGARLRGASQVRFFAIERFLPKLTLQELGDLVGVKKLLLPFEDPRRVLRDAKIARVVGDRIIRELDKLDLPLKYSPISGAVAALERDGGGQLPEAPSTALKFGKAGLYGGRTEVYYCGKWPKEDGGLFYFDFVSAYGRAMMLPLPDYSTAYISKSPQESFFIADCDVETEEVIPGVGPLPHHLKGGGLCFPKGTFRGFWTDVDLALPGVKVVKYHKTVNFPQTGAFLKPIVKRLLPKPGCHKVTKAIRKNLYTGLSGKFSQTNEFTLFIHGVNAKPADYWQGVPFGDWMLVDRKGRPPRTSNYVWSAYIQARNRTWQYQLYESIHTAGGRILYGDTDSALAWLPSALHARKVAESQQLQTKTLPLSEAELLSPKIYRMVDKKGGVILSTKGVPRRLVSENVVLGEDTIEGEVPDSFFMLLKANQAGQLFKNRWTKRKWKFRATNQNRQLLPGKNWTNPLTINNGVVESRKFKPQQRGK